jgi:hypothetical protein
VGLRCQIAGEVADVFTTDLDTHGVAVMWVLRLPYELGNHQPDGRTTSRSRVGDLLEFVLMVRLTCYRVKTAPCDRRPLKPRPVHGPGWWRGLGHPHRYLSTLVLNTG